MVVKVGLSDFSRVDGLVLNADEGHVASAVIDVASGFAYFGTISEPGKIVKVRLSDFRRVGALTLNQGENDLRSAVIDDSRGFAYFGTDTSPGIVVKVLLSNLTRVGSSGLRSDENGLRSAIMDVTNNYAYFGTQTGIVVKIRLSDLKRIGPLALNPGEGFLRSAAIDTMHGFAYFATDTFPGMIVRIRLSDFTRVDSLTLRPGEGSLAVAVIDLVRGFALVGTDTQLWGRVIKINLANFTRVGTLTLAGGESNLRSGIFDSQSGFAYFGTYTYPGIIVKINLVTAPPIAPSSTVMSTATSVVVPNPGFLILGVAPELLFGLVGLVAAGMLGSTVLVLRKRRKGAVSAAAVKEIAGPSISTGYGELDVVLGGGLPEGYAVCLVSPASDERDLLLRKIIGSALSAGKTTVLVSGDIGRTQDLAGRYHDNFYAYCTRADKMISPPKNVYKIPGIGNLSEINISFSQATISLAESKTGKLIVVDLLSDVLVQHKAVMTRRWLEEFIVKRKSEGYTILTTLNPLVAAKEETQTIIDLFDGVIEIYEKELRERARRFLFVKKMYGRRYSETELLLDKDKLF